MSEASSAVDNAWSRKGALRNAAQHVRHAGRQALAIFAMTLLESAARLLPLRACQRLGGWFGLAATALARRRRQMMGRNLAAGLGNQLSATDRQLIQRQVARNMGMLYAELLKSCRQGDRVLKALVSVQGVGTIHRALKRGRGALLLSAHFGNWELMGARLAAEDFELAVVARDAPGRLVPTLINRARTALGVETLGRDDVPGMLAALRQNHCLGILADQHARVGAIPLEFLGRRVWAPRGPAVLALRTGCAVIPVFCHRRPDDTLEVRVLDEIPLPTDQPRRDAVVELTKRMNRAIEEQVRAAPEQWLWLHNRWKAETIEARRSPSPPTSPG